MACRAQRNDSRVRVSIPRRGGHRLPAEGRPPPLRTRGHERAELLAVA